jgi:hypothetical protein
MQQSPDIPDLSSGTANPLLAPISIAAAFSSLVAWNTKGVGSLGTFFCVGTGIIGAWGFWAVRIMASRPVSLLLTPPSDAFLRFLVHFQENRRRQAHIYLVIWKQNSRECSEERMEGSSKGELALEDHG